MVVVHPLLFVSLPSLPALIAAPQLVSESGITCLTTIKCCVLHPEQSLADEEPEDKAYPHSFDGHQQLSLLARIFL